MKTGENRLSFLASMSTFGVVGASASATHFIVALTLVESARLGPLNANAIAFISAFWLSYFGHRHYTFQSSSLHKKALPRFLAAAALGLFLSQTVIYFTGDVLGWPYYASLVVSICLVSIVMYPVGRL